MTEATDQTAQQLECVVALAQQLVKYGQCDRALKILALADWIMPDDPEAMNVRILALTRLGRWAEALDIIESNGALKIGDHKGLAEIY